MKNLKKQLDASSAAFKEFYQALKQGYADRFDTGAGVHTVALDESFALKLFKAGKKVSDILDSMVEV